MEFYQTFFITAALSLPFVTFIALCRAALCVFRSVSARHLKFTVVSGLGSLILLVIFAAVVVVWLTYGVAHTGKDASTDLIVLVSTGAVIYVGAFSVWRLSFYIEKRLDLDAN